MLRHSARFLLVMFSVIAVAPRSLVVAQEPESSEIKIELIDAGKSPRKELRFAPKVGSQESNVMTISMTQGITIGGNELPAQKVPTQEISMLADVTEVAANGDIAYTFTYEDFKLVDDPKSPSPAAGAMQDMIKPLIGSKGSGKVTNRGIGIDVDYQVPDDAAPTMKAMFEGMRESMKQIASPMPQEAVGVGAKWRTTQTMVANGIRLTQTAEHELTELTESGFSSKSTITQSAEPQEVKNSLLPPGTTMKIESLKTSGEATSTYLFASIFPVKNKSTLHSDIDMSMSIAGQEQEMKNVMDVEVQMNSGGK